MKKIIFLLVFFMLLHACALKNTQKSLSSGDYDAAISTAISRLKSNKDKKGKQDYVYLLEEAFAKAKERDLNTLDLLEKEANPAQLEKIYQTYVTLNARQERIKGLLPLRLIKENREAIFPLEDYNDKLVASKNALSRYLYANAKLLFSNNRKMDYRKAFDDFTYLNQINPYYKDVNELLKEAKFKGSDYVLATTKNETNMILPGRLENDLLDFNTYGLNEKWTVYHNSKQDGFSYDFGLLIRFREISISPEQTKEREFNKERRIKDGQKRLIDANGKEVLDDKGKVVFVDNYKDVAIQIYEFQQFKSCLVVAKVEYVDFNSNQLLQSFPLNSEFIFKNVYANYKGDRRAAEDTYFSFFDKRGVPFPSNEQMVYDTGEDLKNKLKQILNQYPLRN